MFERVYISLVTILDLLLWVVDAGPSVHKFFLAPNVGTFRVFLGRIRAVRLFHYAKKHVPAYKDYLSKHTYKGPQITIHGANLRDIPEMDKASYIKPYFLTQKLKNGVLPKSGVMLDESSGSKGKPTNSARGKDERRMTRRLI